MKNVNVFFNSITLSLALLIYICCFDRYDCFQRHQHHHRNGMVSSKSHMHLLMGTQQDDFKLLFKRTIVSSLFSLPLICFSYTNSEINSNKKITTSSIASVHASNFEIDSRYQASQIFNQLSTQLPYQSSSSTLLSSSQSLSVLSMPSNEHQRYIESPVIATTKTTIESVITLDIGLNDGIADNNNENVENGKGIENNSVDDDNDDDSDSGAGVISKAVDQAAIKINEQKQIIINMFNALKDAYLVDNFDTFIAVSIAEAVSGIVAGFSSRKFADFLNDKKKDSVFTKLSSTGVFFGSRSFFRTISTLIGIPRPIALIIGSLSGSLLSELTKYIGRIFASEIEKDRDIMSYELNRNDNSNGGGGINSVKFIQPPVNIPKSINPNKQFFFNIFSGRNTRTTTTTSNNNNPTAKFVSKPVNIPKSIYPKKQPFISLFISPIRTVLVNITREVENKQYPQQLLKQQQQQQDQPSLELLEVLEVIVVKEKNLNELLLNKDRQEVISKKEISADLVKWLTFDALEEIVTIPEDPYIFKIMTYFGLGSVSASAGYLVKRVLNKKLLNENETLFKDILEGGVLFATYSVLQNYLMSMAPPELSQQLPFYKVLQTFESAVEEKL